MTVVYILILCFNKENGDFTFWKNLKYLNSFISNSGLDLFYLSLFVYGADRIISRSTGNDSWGRDIKLYIPVIELEIWNSNKE